MWAELSLGLNVGGLKVKAPYLPGLKNVIADFLSRPHQTTTGSSGFRREAAKQNRCLETQRLLGGTSLKLAFHQTGPQRLAGDVSTGNFSPSSP